MLYSDKGKPEYKNGITDHRIITVLRFPFMPEKYGFFFSDFVTEKGVVSSRNPSANKKLNGRSSQAK